MSIWLSLVVRFIALLLPVHGTIDTIVVGKIITANASESLSGLGLEDANHQLYGGLYAQMIFGESFEEPVGSDGASGSEPWLVPAQPGYYGTFQGPTWRTVHGTPAVSTSAFTGEQSQRLPPGSAVENTGLLGAGMFFQQGREYGGVLFVRAVENGNARLTISTITNTVIVGEFVVNRNWTMEWQRIDFTITPNLTSSCLVSGASPNHTETCNDAHELTGCIDGCVSSPELGNRCVVCTGQLRLSVDGSATLEVDQISLLPGAWGRFSGLPVRKDLAELMTQGNAKGMHLSALRLGGSMVLCEGYRWKNFRGPRELRQPFRGVWYRYNSAGWKIFEFLELCEATQIQSCVVTLNVNEDVTDLEDLIEYAFGPATTPWGAQRLNDGREKPYLPFLVEIGNENTLNFTGKEPIPCRDSCANFSARWAERALAMDAKARSLGLYLTFIVGFDAGVGGGQSCSKQALQDVEMSILNMAELAAPLGPRAVWDCHTGGDSPSDGNITASALQELQSILQHAGSQMRAAVLEENGGTHDMLRMLGHVTQNHALSRLGEFVVVNTVATGLQPLGRNSVGWDQGNIFFTPNQAWLAPPAIATRMIASVSRGMPNVLKVEHRTGLDVLATQSRIGDRLGLRVANPTNATLHTSFDISGWHAGFVSVEILQCADPSEVRVETTTTNTTLTELTRDGWKFAPYSFTTFLSVRTEGSLWI